MNSSSAKAIRNLTVIWLTTCNDHTHLLGQLTHIRDAVRIFTEINQCIDYLTEIKTAKIFMIIDYILESELLSLIDELPQVNSIYFLRNREIQHHRYTLVSTKVKGTFNDIESIWNMIKVSIQRWNDGELTISSINPTDVSSNDLNRIDSSFMYSQLIKEILLKINYGDVAKTELAEYCRDVQSCGGTKNVSSVIDEFEKDYDEHSAVWWYTRDCFAYVMLNQALRNQDVKTLIKIGFFLRDVHRRIEYLHRMRSLNQFTVYRGQGMFKDEFEKKILKNPGGLLSFNNFLSTSLSYDVANLFAESIRGEPTLLGIVFQMHVDATISSASFAELQSTDSYNSCEQEVLFSMHTIFRIDEVKKIDDRLWHVKLKLTSDRDEDLVSLGKRLRTEIEGGHAWYRLSRLLLKIGKFTEATDVLTELLNAMPENNWKYLGAINHQLGLINGEKGDYKMALLFYNTALKHLHHNFPIDHRSLGTTYNAIGEIHREQGNNLQALLYYQKTLEYFEKSFMFIHPWEFGILYSNIGQVFRSMGDYSTALGFFRKTLDVYNVILRPNDPLFAIVYNNIGAVYADIGNYSQALTFYNKTLHIEQRSLPADHPSLAVTHNNLGNIHLGMTDYSNALLEFEKSIDISEKSLCSDHPSIASIYVNMGQTYTLMNGDYLMALFFYEKARHILETNGASNNPNLAILYNMIGGAYRMRGDYLNARFAFKKALEIQKRSLSSNHLINMSQIYAGMAMVFYDTHDHQQALIYSERAIEVARKDKTPAGAKNLECILKIFIPMHDNMQFRRW